MYDKQSMFKIIEELNKYFQQGSMDRQQIGETIRSLQEIYIRESIMEYNLSEENIEDYIRANLKQTAKNLNRSVATVYRKLHDHSFTLAELMLINNMRYSNGEVDFKDFVEK